LLVCSSADPIRLGFGCCVVRTCSTACPALETLWFFVAEVRVTCRIAETAPKPEADTTTDLAGPVRARELGSRSTQSPTAQAASVRGRRKLGTGLADQTAVIHPHEAEPGRAAPGPSRNAAVTSAFAMPPNRTRRGRQNAGRHRPGQEAAWPPA